MHWMALEVAHVKPETAGFTDAGGVLDKHTRACLGCHDGVSAPDSTNTTPWNPGKGFTGDRGRSHPVGVPYSRRASRLGGARLRPASLLPREIRLPGGTVGCLSCHNLYARDRHRLAVPIKGSALCFSCHDMR